MIRKSSDQLAHNLLPADYDDLLREMKQRILTAQVKAALAVSLH